MDWWAFGVLIYEMLAGYPPFYEEDTAQTYQRILHGRFTFPSDFPVTVRDLVRKLLQVRTAGATQLTTPLQAARNRPRSCASSKSMRIMAARVLDDLQVDLSKRYGCLVSGVNDVKSHPWLRSIDWVALRSGKLEPPIRYQARLFDASPAMLTANFILETVSACLTGRW